MSVLNPSPRPSLGCPFYIYLLVGPRPKRAKPLEAAQLQGAHVANNLHDCGELLNAMREGPPLGEELMPLHVAHHILNPVPNTLMSAIKAPLIDASSGTVHLVLLELGEDATAANVAEISQPALTVSEPVLTACPAPDCGVRIRPQVWACPQDNCTKKGDAKLPLVHVPLGIRAEGG